MVLETDKTQTPTPLDAAAIGNIVRDEIDRRDKYLDFAQDQIAKISGLFKLLFTVTGTLLTAIAIAAAIIGYKSVNDMRAEMRTDMKDLRDEMKHVVETELALDKKAMEELRVDVAFAKNDALAAQAKVKDSLNNVHKEVEGKLNTEFNNENIKQLMNSVATEKVKDTVIKELEPIIKIETLATQALADNRQAFDYLRQVKLGNSPESTNPDLRKIAESVTEKIIQDSEAEKMEFANPNLNEVALNSMGDIMAIKNPVIRQMSLDKFLDNHPKNASSFLPMLVEMIKLDSSISVLEDAVKRFNGLTKQKQPFKFYQVDEIQDWWDKNKASFQ